LTCGAGEILLASTIGDVISVHVLPRSISLSDLAALREALERDGTELSLPVAGQLEELLGEYIADQDEAEEALRAIMATLSRVGSNQGSAMLVQGPARSGKSHLLTVIALLLEYPPACSAFVNTHPQFRDLTEQIRHQPPLLVVPVPLDEHRGDREHLEDIIFDCTEQELSRPKYNLDVSLSQQSYAVSLIRRHIVPRYGAQLNGKARDHPGGYTTFDQLLQRQPTEAVAIARQVAQELGYPLDFRQSRTERLSRLSQIVAEQKWGGVVWLVDDLSGFLGSVDFKAVRNDCGFLEFLGQRCKIEPLYLVAVLQESFEQIAGLEPYLLSSIRTLYDPALKLSAAQMHKVAHQRLISEDDGESVQQTVADAHQAYEAAFGETTFDLAELVDSYPLHPVASHSLETVVHRYLGSADGLARFAAAPSKRGGLSNYLERDRRQLLGPVEIFSFLGSVLESHPEAAPYFTEVDAFYQRNADQIAPENPTLASALVRCLIVLRLANISASVSLIAECLGLTEEGSCRIDTAQAEQLLETIRLMGSYVDVRRGPAPGSSAYLVDASTSLTQLVRRRLNALKATLADDDPRLWRRIVACSDSPSWPLASLSRPQLEEVIWENSYRTVSVETANLSTLTVAQIATCINELNDPSTVEDARLFMAELHQCDAQLTAWNKAQSSRPKSRWAAGLLAWIPRALTVQEIDMVKQCVACHELLHEPAPEADLQAAWRSRLLEERMTLDNQVRQLSQQAYYEGQVMTLTGETVTSQQLSTCRGDWTASLATASRPAWNAVFPDFPALAPRRLVTSQEQINRLISEVIAEAPLSAEPESTLHELCEAFLTPLGLVTYENHTIHLQIKRSPVAQEIIRLIRQRDQAAEHEQGRPLSCPDLAQHLLKSPMGLPPWLFELAVAVLVRLGYLVALDEERQPLRFEDIGTPFSNKVQFIARPPLLPLSTWQVLSRLARTLLGTGIPGPDYAVQQDIWEQLLINRDQQLTGLEELQGKLQHLCQSLGQRPEKWQQSFTDISDAVEFFQMIDAHKHATVGLSEFVSRLEPYMSNSHGLGLLSSLLQRIDDLEDFLDEVGPLLTTVKEYIDSPELQIADASELGKRRQSLIELIESGEEMIGQQLAFRRYLQRFLTAFKRQYLAWHNQVYRNPVFDQYRALLSSGEYRALAQLERLDIEVEHTASRVAQLIDSYADRRCTYPDLAAALDHRPICPACGLALGEEIQLPPVEELKEAIRAGLREYAQVLSEPQFRQQLTTYAAALPRRGDIPDKLHKVAQLPAEPSPKEILTLVTDNVIGHVNRVLAGKAVIPRNFAELREALAGHTLTKKQTQELFKAWLSGSDPDLDDEELLDITD